MTQDVTEAADQHPLLASSSFSPQPSFLRRRPNDKRSDRKQHTAQITHPPIAQSQNVNCECFDRYGFNTQTRWDTPSARTGCGRGRSGMPGGALHPCASLGPDGLRNPGRLPLGWRKVAGVHAACPNATHVVGAAPCGHTPTTPTAKHLNFTPERIKRLLCQFIVSFTTKLACY